MTFKDVKVTCVKADGPCSRSKVGTTFYVKNACLEIPPGEKICLFLISSLLVPLSGAIMKTEKGEGMLDLLQEWQCPDSEAKVVFKIERIDTEHNE